MGDEKIAPKTMSESIIRNHRPDQSAALIDLPEPLKARPKPVIDRNSLSTWGAISVNDNTSFES
jgi:hypothetical protein